MSKHQNSIEPLRIFPLHFLAIFDSQKPIILRSDV